MTNPYEPNKLNDAVEEYKEVKRMADQDVPRDPSLLPKDVPVVADVQATALLRQAGQRPAKESIGDTVLAVTDNFTDGQIKKIVSWLWYGIKPGSSLFIDPDSPAKPDVKPEHRKVEGFKKYTK
jgi:hypothetical protein